MTPWKLLRKFVKLVRGGAASPQIFLGCLLGMIIGMTPGFNMTVVIAALVLLLLSANVGLAILGFVLGKVLCLLLAPVTFQIGYVIIHRLGLEGAFRAASETPVVALMDLHYYCLTGGLPVAIVLGCAFGWAMVGLIRKVRLGLTATTARSEKLRRLAGKPLVRFLLRVIFGKQKGTLAEMLGARQPLFRKSGVILCAVLLAGVGVFEFFFVDDLVEAGLVSGLEAAAGAEVNVEDVDVSLFGGRLTVTGLQVTDAGKPTHNAVQAASLAADVSITSLLARRFVIDKLTITRLRTDARRESPGKVFEKPERPEPEITDETISQYFERGKEILDYLQRLKEYLDQRQKGKQTQTGGPSKEDLEEEARRRGYLKLSARSVLARRPAVTIRQVEVSDIVLGTDPASYSLAGREVSDKPELHEKPMWLTLRSDRGVDVAAELDFTSPAGAHRLRASVLGVKLGETVRLSGRVPVDVRKATVDVLAEGGFDHETIRLPVILTIRDLEANARPGQGLWGLDPETTAKMFEAASELDLVVGLEGPVEAPRLIVDEARGLDSLKKAMVKAGRNELAAQADKQLKALGVQLPGDLPTDLGKATPGDALKGLDSIFGPKKAPTTQPAEERKEEPTSKSAGGLEDLFK